MSREISDNAKRLEMVEDNLGETELEKIKTDLSKLYQIFEASTKRNDDTLKQIKEKFEKIDSAMDDYNKNLKIVYESTVGAVMDKLIRKSLDYLADFGEFCVNIMENIIDKITEVNWKYYYDQLTDPKQQQKFKDWIMG